MDAAEIGTIFHCQVSQGSVETHWDGNLYNEYTKNSLEIWL